MVDQETISDRTSSSTNGKKAASLNDLVPRLVSLIELQAELFRVDLRDGLARLLVSCVLVGVAALAAMATACIALFFIASIFADLLGFSQMVALGIAMLIGIVLAVGLGAAAWASLRAGLQVFHRSWEEGARTVRWIKNTARHPMSANHPHDGEM